MKTATLITRGALLAEARTWIGTPFKHQGRVRRVGVDCIGMIVQPARDLGIPCVDDVGYSRQPNAAHTLSMVTQSFVQVPLDQMRPGDVYFIALGQPEQPHHFGYRTEVGILHAFDDVRRDSAKKIRMGKATETRFPADWTRRIHSCWRFKYFAEAGI